MPKYRATFSIRKLCTAIIEADSEDEAEDIADGLYEDEMRSEWDADIELTDLTQI